MTEQDAREMLRVLMLLAVGGFAIFLIYWGLR